MKIIKNLILPILLEFLQKKVAWICEKCGNKWIASVADRAVQGSGCPICAIKIRSERRHKTALKNNGYFNDKELLKDWNTETNLPLTPADFTPTSNSYVHWKCHKCGYKWKAKINNRVNGRGCPVCGNKVAVKGVNDLATTHPILANEWHPTLNNGLTPDMVTYGCGKKIFWLCPKGHVYKATINHRSGKNGTGCPECNVGRQTSFAEQAIFYYVKKEFPDAINKYKPDWLRRMELDIFIPSWNTAIEYDGAQWHKEERLKLEQIKYALCKERNIKLIRIREKFPEVGSEIADYQFGNDLKLYEHKNLNRVIRQLLDHLTFYNVKYFDIDVSRDEQNIFKLFK